MKTCTHCKEAKPREAFHARRGARDGLSSWCKDCKREQQRSLYDDPQYLKASIARLQAWTRRKHHARYTRGKHGLTIEEARIRVNEAGCCALCSSRDTLRIDHDHSTGAIRGVLCNKCNLGLGMFKDDPEVLEAAAHYVRSARYTTAS